MDSREWEVTDVDQLHDIAAEMLSLCSYGKKFAFYGPMGVGKTTFIAAICRQLGSHDQSGSPTFSIVREYNCGEPVYHMDCYRLQNIEEALDTGIQELLDGPHFCFVEWPDRIEALLPEEIIRIQMRFSDEAISGQEPPRKILIKGSNSN